MILRLIWRNLWRNPRRTWITTVSITFSVFLAISMQSFQKGSFDNLINNIVGYHTGYIQVHRQGYWNEQILDNGFTSTDTLTGALEAIQGIHEIVPRIETFVLASAGKVSKGCLLVGTDPVKEDHMTQLSKKLIAGSYFNPGEDAVILAEGLAKRLGVNVQDTMVLFGQGYQGTMAAGKYLIKGIVHLAAPALNDNMVYLPLTSAQYLLSAEGMLTSLALKIDHPENMLLIQKEVSGTLPSTYEVMTWEEMMPEIANHIKADGFTSYIFSGILYLIISFGFFGTILMMTAERRYEFGMLIAIGMKKMKLGWILVGETFLITLLGIIFGVMVSFPFVLYFNRYPIRFTGQTAKAYEQFGFEALMPTAVHPPIFVTQSIIVLVMALVIGLYPLWHVRRLDPVEAMKY
jgi:ABC-type lipoprotein release transport system permease subunit